MLFFVFVCGDVCGCCGWWVQDGWTAFMLAAIFSHGSVVAMLLQKEGVDINVTDRVSVKLRILLMMSLTSTMTFLCVWRMLK